MEFVKEKIEAVTHRQVSWGERLTEKPG